MQQENRSAQAAMTFPLIPRTESCQRRGVSLAAGQRPFVCSRLLLLSLVRTPVIGRRAAWRFQGGLAFNVKDPSPDKAGFAGSERRGAAESLWRLLLDMLHSLPLG